MRVLVIAKAPVPGLVKTRLCPPCTQQQAAAVAAAALQDTVDVVSRAPACARVLVVEGGYRAPAGWSVHPQRGNGLGQRLANAFTDCGPGVLIGMDTPQVTPALLTDLHRALADADAVLGPAVDGGWWALGLRDVTHASVLARVPMSTPDTAELTVAALRARGLSLAWGPRLRDVDTASDARAVAQLCQGGHFAAAVAAHVPRGLPEVVS